MIFFNIRKQLIIFWLVLLQMITVSQKTSAQVISDFNSGNQEFIQKMTDTALFVVRQEYVLVGRSGQEYGRGGRKYFGISYTLATLSNFELWCDESIKTPWLNDTNYESYKNIDSLSPKLFKSYFRPVIDTSYQEMKQDSALLGQSVNGLVNYHIRYVAKGLTIPKQKDPTGWVIIAYTNAPILDDDQCEILFSIYKERLDFTLLGPLYIKNPSIETHKPNILGGVYVMPKFYMGKMELLLCGITHKTIAKKWEVLPVPLLDKKQESQLVPIKTNEGSSPSRKKKTKNKK